MDVKATYKNKLNVLKTFITMMVVTVFLAFNGIRSEAKVIQTQEGDDQVTVTWDDKTNTDYAIGYAKVEGNVTDAMHTAKAMAAGRSIVLPSTQKSYTITGLSVNSQYVVYLLRKTGSIQVDLIAETDLQIILFSICFFICCNRNSSIISF